MKFSYKAVKTVKNQTIPQNPYMSAGAIRASKSIL